MMFTACVMGAALSGLTALVLPAKLTNAIDAVLAKFLRSLSGGDMSWQREDGSIRCHNTDR
eukprot:7251446-Pyramimonas_sp.AAC.1